MRNLHNAPGEEAWLNYQEIGRVLDQRYQLSTIKAIEHSGITMAFQRLGEALVRSHKLDPRTHVVSQKWILRIAPNDDQIPRLFTVAEMLNAKISEWEDEMPTQQAGHDSYVDGHEAGYRSQQSLQEALKIPFFTIKAIVNTSIEQALEMFSKIRDVVGVEIKRLQQKDPDSPKIKEISNAVQLLYKAVLYKYKSEVDGVRPLSKKEQDCVDSMDLYTFDTMLRAKIGKYSVRQALNLSSESPFSKIFSLQEALWGQTTALNNVERALMNK